MARRAKGVPRRHGARLCNLNGPDSAGIGAIPMNNQAGVRMSTAITHLNPVRHRLNLTVKGNVFVRRVLFHDAQVPGVEAESGGEIFTVEGNQVVLSAGALKSPPANHRSSAYQRVCDRPGKPSAWR